MEQVPFSGGGPALTALLGGHVDLLVANTGEVKSLVESDEVRVLATTQEDAIEDEVFADVPTLIEKGFDVNLQVWQGIGAPKGIPSDIKEVLEKGFEEIINDPEFIEEAEKIGIDVIIWMQMNLKNYGNINVEYLVRL